MATQLGVARDSDSKGATLNISTKHSGSKTPSASPVANAAAEISPQAHAEPATKSGTSADVASSEVLGWSAYQRDFCERAVLFWDTLRQRANNMLEHERAGLPPLLDFKSETLLDARRFERPVNYALLRITEIGEKCWDDCVDPNKPPVIVVDPRAGHGPGIGGFKHDSGSGDRASRRSSGVLRHILS